MLASLLALALTTAPVQELAFDWTSDSIIAGSAMAFWLGSELLKPELAPAGCRWCDSNPDGSNALNPLDAWARGARWSLAAQPTADVIGTIDAYGVTLVAMVGLDALFAARNGALRRAPEDVLMAAEAVAFAASLSQVVKFVVGRERPFVHVLSADQKLLTAQPDDNNLSFFSGHTTFAFAAVAAMGTIADLRGYPEAPWIWAVGLPLAASVGYLRIAADKHYLTDVLVGAAVGTAMGIVLPRWLHPRGHGAIFRPWASLDSVGVEAKF